MKIDVADWKEFLLKDLFVIEYGNKFDNDKMSHDNPTINFVSRTAKNNGVSDVVDEIPGCAPYARGDITVALGGSIGTCSIQLEPFYTGQNVAVLKSNNYSILTKLFISQLIQTECSIKYCAFGRELNKHIKTDFSIYMPIVYMVDSRGRKVPQIDETYKYSPKGYIPDFEWIELYMNSLHCMPITTTITTGIASSGNKPKLELDTSEWIAFNVSRTKEQAGLLDIEDCKCSCAADLIDGDEINYIGAKKNDNGVMKRVKIEPSLVSKGNGILFICDGQGSVGYTNYMDVDFIGSTTTAIGYDENLNPINAMFLVGVLDKERFKYSFGRKYKTNLPKAKILLPVKKAPDGTPVISKICKYSQDGYIPDFEWMENFIKQLPYSDRI